MLQNQSLFTISLPDIIGMDETKPRPQAHLEWFIFVLWAAMVLWLISRHAIWADEARAWLIASRTENWATMFTQTHADGHPILWYAFLRLASYLHNGLRTFYAVHFIFAALAAAFCLALKRLPLSLRLILLFGGILGHEFAVVGRNYAPAVVALFAYAYFYPSRDAHPVRSGLLLALALNFHAGLAPLVPLLMLPWLVDAWTHRKKSFLMASAIVACGYIALLASIFPPFHDSIFTTMLHKPVSRAAEFLPSHQLIPLITIGLSDILDFDKFFTLPICIFVSIAFLLIVYFLFSSLVFRVSAIGMLITTSLFYAVTYPVLSYRHSALLIVSLVTLLAIEPPNTENPAAQKIASTLFSSLIILQVLRLALVISYPFSTSALARSILSQDEYKDARVICLPDWMGQTIAAQDFADCKMVFVERTGPFPLFLLRDYAQPIQRLKNLTDWMKQEEAQGRPALAYIHTLFMPTMPVEPADFGQSHRRGRRFMLLSTQAEIRSFLEHVEELTPRVTTVSPENGVLLRLKPEYRGGPAPSDAPRTDP